MFTIFLQQICRDSFFALSLGELSPKLNAGHAIAAPSEAGQAGSQQGSQTHKTDTGQISPSQDK